MEKYIFLGLILYFTSYFFYIYFSHGLGHKAAYLQLRRFLPCAILAVLPIYLTLSPIISKPYLISMGIGLLWIVTYPLLYFFTYNKSSSDFGFHFDIVFGLYFIGWSISLKLLLNYFDFFHTFTIFILSLFEVTIFSIILFQWIYYSIYRTCINDNAIMLIRETDFNETIEFYKSLPLLIQIITPFILSAAFFEIFLCNISIIQINTLSISTLALLVIITIFLTFYLWNTKKGVFIRTGIIELILDVQNYIQETKQYNTYLQQRLSNLEVITQNLHSNSPSTIIIIIGESESKDYMSAFCDYEYNTTPWLKDNKNINNFILFTNAYACKDQTVPALERALTEANQYNTKKFSESCSIIDIARFAGYKTYWFSNQGNIGSAETAITLIANTADKAVWTKQNLNQFQYDETLLDYLKELDPNENNFVVLHFIGNHFNFINRYPPNFATFSQPGKYDLIPNYLDSIAYTDYVLKKITEYASKKLNLQALLYFSDHATIPDKRRSPNFDGFGVVRIPMFTYFSNNYIETNKEIYNILRKHQHHYFTNDLIYELVCGILNIKSNHYDETNSLASAKYKFTKETLLTDLGKKSIKDDIRT